MGKGQLGICTPVLFSMHRLTRTGRFQFDRHRANMSFHRSSTPDKYHWRKRRVRKLAQFWAGALGTFLFFAIWLVFFLLPMRDFRIAPERSLSATVRKIERLALVAARGEEPLHPQIDTAASN